MYARGAALRSPDEGDLADVHPLDSQRYYNVLCLADGAGAGRHTLAGRGLPAERVDSCPWEFSQVQAAMEQLVAPHADPLLRVKRGEAATRAGLDVKRRLAWAKGMARAASHAR
jgi:hypothetical protein